jgi:phosphatidate cytidylyltransferase
LKQRILTGVMAGLFFFIFLMLGGYWYSGLILLLSIIGYDEFARMNDMKKHRWTSAIGLAAMLLIAIPWETNSFFLNLDLTAVIWIAMFVLLFITVSSKNAITIDQISVLWLGAVYIGMGFHYMMSIRITDHGLFWSIFIFICIWASDSGAYFVGSKLGKHPLWPQISPKKSIEGAIGGIIFSVIAALIFAGFVPELLTFARAILLGFVIAIVGQLGDLIQSAYKRVKGIKDSGKLLPGHGGVLDRVDSWLIVFPFLFWLGLIPH